MFKDRKKEGSFSDEFLVNFVGAESEDEQRKVIKSAAHEVERGYNVIVGFEKESDWKRRGWRIVILGSYYTPEDAFRRAWEELNYLVSEA